MRPGASRCRGEVGGAGLHPTLQLPQCQLVGGRRAFPGRQICRGHPPAPPFIGTASASLASASHRLHSHPFIMASASPAPSELHPPPTQVQTDRRFWLARRHNDWFTVKGKLKVENRERDLVSTADVFNHYLTSSTTPLIARVAAVPSSLFYSAAARGTAFRVDLPGARGPRVGWWEAGHARLATEAEGGCSGTRSGFRASGET